MTGLTPAHAVAVSEGFSYATNHILHISALLCSTAVPVLLASVALSCRPGCSRDFDLCDSDAGDFRQLVNLKHRI